MRLVGNITSVERDGRYPIYEIVTHPRRGKMKLMRELATRSSFLITQIQRSPSEALK
jgi:hypothetical protein